MRTNTDTAKLPFMRGEWYHYNNSVNIRYNTEPTNRHIRADFSGLPGKTYSSRRISIPRHAETPAAKTVADCR